MRLGDYHTHCNYCDHAVEGPGAYVRSAIATGLAEVGLSDHFPMMHLPDWFQHNAMAADRWPAYLAETRALRDHHAGRITVKLATEVDYFEPATGIPATWRAALARARPHLDYTIGSIHVLPHPDFEAIPIDNDADPARFRATGVKRVFLQYYETHARLVRSGEFDTLGHFDSIKASGFQLEDDPEVWEAICRVADALEASGMAVEVNTAGLRKWGEQCPSPRITRELIARGIPLVLGSDAHAPAQVAHAFPRVLALLKKWGLEALGRWTRGELSLVEV